MGDSSASNLFKTAIDNGRIDVLRGLLTELSSKPKEFHQAVDSISTLSGSLLHYATERSDVDAVRALLASGANPCVQNDSGRMPMQLCQTADIASAYTQELLQSVAQSKLGRVCQMLSSGVPVDSVDSPSTLNSALHYAASYGNEDVVRVLCEGGANVNIINAKSDTPLHDAILRGDISIVKQLLRYGSNPSLRNHAGHDCFDVARSRAMHRPEILQCLSMHSLASSQPAQLDPQMKDTSASLQSLASVDEMASLNGSPNENSGHLMGRSPRQHTVSANYPVSDFTTPNSFRKTSHAVGSTTSPVLRSDPQQVSLIANFYDVKIENWPDYLWPQPKRLNLAAESSARFGLPDRRLRIFMLANSELNFRDVMHIWNLYGPQFSAMHISLQFEYQLQKVYSESGSGLSCGVYGSLFQVPESYSLQIQECGMELLASDIRGLKSGVSTLAQIIRIYYERERVDPASGLTLPCVTIQDWPDTLYRACLIDFTGCRIFGTDTLLKIALRLAYVKANQLVVHFEQRVQDRHFSIPYNQKEVFHLRQQCADACLEFVPSLDLNCEELDHRLAAELLQKFFERFPDCRTVHFGTNLSHWLIRNPEIFVSAVPSTVRHIYLAVKDVSGLNQQKLRSLPPICTLCINTAQLLSKDQDFFAAFGNTSVCLSFLTSDVGYFCQAPEEMIKNAVLASKLGEKYNALAIMSCDLSTGCEIVPQSLAFLPELAILGVGWNRATDMRRFCFLMPHVAAEHILSDRKMTTLFQQILMLGYVEHELSKMAAGVVVNSVSNQRKPSTSSTSSISVIRMPPLSVFVQLLLNPDAIDLEQLNPVIFKKARIELTRCLQTLHNLKKELPYNFDLALCVAEVQLITELMILATKIGQALCLVGSNPRHDFGSPLVNVGVANLPLTARTDLANKLLEVRTQFQHAWLSRNLASTLPNALKIFDNLFKTLLPPALQGYGENLL